MIFKQFKYHKIYFSGIFFIWLGLFIDSKEISTFISYNQWITNIIVILTFIYIYQKSTVKIKKIMIYGLGLALVGESFFCLLLGMYTYRLENLPIYVPFGHSIVYASVFYITKEPFIKKIQVKLINIMYVLMVLFCIFWLFIQNDTLGFICFICILYLFYKRPQMKLFYLTMFFMVLYLELVGTYYNCWIWPDIWFNRISLISSANPPSSISLFYFGFDLGCLWIYKQLNKSKWHRMKNIKSLSK